MTWTCWTDGAKGLVSGHWSGAVHDHLLASIRASKSSCLKRIEPRILTAPNSPLATNRFRVLVDSDKKPAASSGVIRRTVLWLLIAASVRWCIKVGLKNYQFTCSSAANKARQWKQRVISFTDRCLDCCRLRDGVVFANGCKLQEALTPAPNTKTCAVLMEGLACPP